MGRVIHGKQRARAWGIPTANIHLKQRPLLLSGVFLVRVRRHASPENRTYWGVANLGCRPTVDGLTTILEVHVFDFSDSLYNERLEVFFIKHLREERKFSSVDALITQIHEDRKQAYASCNDLKIEQDE
jgi:riboflavin kinase/FMN adenylyltransferase